MRIGERLSEVLSKEEMEGFDAISVPQEAAKWLDKHVSNYRKIVDEERKKANMV